MVEFRYSQTIFFRFTVTLFHSNLDEKITTNEQLANEQKVASNEQKVTSNEHKHKITSNEQKVSSNEQKVQPRLN